MPKARFEHVEAHHTHTHTLTPQRTHIHPIKSIRNQLNSI